MLGNTPSRETLISVERAKSFALGMMFKSADGHAVDLTGSIIRMTATELGQWGGRIVLERTAEHISELGGYVQFKFQAEDMDLRPGQYPYDITLVTPQNYSIAIIKGYLEIGSNTDSDVSNVYTDVHTGADITVTLGNQNAVEITVERIDGMYEVIHGLIADFKADVDKVAIKVEAAAQRSEAAAAGVETDISELKVWMASAGFPYWRGSPGDYAQLTPNPNVLYLITQ